MRYKNMLEEELKNTVAKDFFHSYDCTKIIQKIDFAVCMPDDTIYGPQYFLWAEAKARRNDVFDMLTQLVLTIGKQKQSSLKDAIPPPYLGCFDAQEIAFIPYSEVQGVFITNDFNWKVTSSDTSTKEFAQVRQMIKGIVDNGGEKSQPLIFDFEKDAKELRTFIKQNFVTGKTAPNKISINKGTFRDVYIKWLEVVQPTIWINWEDAKKEGILAGDFYLADLLSSDNMSIKETLFVVLKHHSYEMNRHKSSLGTFDKSEVIFNDHQVAHKQFWAIYERPPLEEYWDYIIDRRDMLVPWDVRERKGSFFTPKKWVDLSREYLADVFGDNWQDDYYIWDCAAGTGNLLRGLTQRYNIYASTIDKADVDSIHTLIETDPFLLHDNVFQFDFLNDSFDKLPPDLLHIINNEPEKLIIYINPPYAEGDAKIGRGRKGIHESVMHDKYKSVLRKASSELFALFLMRIYKEIPGCKIGHFSKLKPLNAPNFASFRSVFLARLERLFIVPADTFDNVNGQFPIGFYIWDTSKKEIFTQYTMEVYDAYGGFFGKKNIYSYEGCRYISDWLEDYSRHKTKTFIGHLGSVGNDFQNQRDVYIDDVNRRRKAGGRHTMIAKENLLVVCIYYAVRHVIANDWLNDRDQFLYPKAGWEADHEFQSDCLTFTLFHNANNISSVYGTNHWIPFTEYEVNARKRFESHFMTDFLVGKIKPENTVNGLFSIDNTSQSQFLIPNSSLLIPDHSSFSQAVFDAGRELWRYYHAQKDCNINASFYDIREHFQGRNEAGRMNTKSTDEMYNKLLGELRMAMKLLAEQIKPKIYEHGFLL